jgi:uncharacterized SAM-binding protein YcdF (DUF218 family)
MGFTASKIFWWIANPGNLLLLALTLTFLSMLFRWRRLAGLLSFLMAATALVIAFAPAREWVLRPLEYRFPPPSLLERVDGVIVLGGAINSDLSARTGQLVVSDSAERLLSFIELGLRYPKAKLLFSGGSPNVLDDSAREADFAKDLFAKLGFDVSRIQFERDSRNTVENARFSKLMAAPGPDEVWLLVTSAYHMPRAVGVFRAIDWQVVPYPVDYGVALSAPYEPAGLLDGLNGVQWGLREWFGLVYYRMSGFTRELFPAP